MAKFLIIIEILNIHFNNFVMEKFATLSLILSLVSMIIIVSDLRKNPQTVQGMGLVWILSAMWGGLIALFAYLWFGRDTSNSKVTDNELREMVRDNVDVGSENSASNVMMAESVNINEIAGGGDISGYGYILNIEEEERARIESICDSVNITDATDICSLPSKPRSKMGFNLPQDKLWQKKVTSILQIGALSVVAMILGEIFIISFPLKLMGGNIVSGWILTVIISILLSMVLKNSVITTKRVILWQLGVLVCMLLYLFLIERGEVYMLRYTAEYWFILQLSMFFGLGILYFWISAKSR